MLALSLAAARRIVLAAQGFATPRPKGVVDRRHLRRVLRHTGLLQIDSVNVVTRAHYVPAFSRLGPYPRAALDRMAWGSPVRNRELFEYWGHEASLLPVDAHSLLRWRMARAGHEAWGWMVRLAREQPAYVQSVLGEVCARGPIRACELPDDRVERGRWWNRSAAKHALEFLFWSGEVTATARTASFERVYDLPERVLPKSVLDAPTPTEEAAYRALLLRAAASLGLGTARDLADYYRLRIPLARARLAELVEDRALLPVRVEGWRELAYLDPGARRPRVVNARALLAPFDPLIWERSRIERLFGVHYRIEIYVPAPQRRYGYYVLPFLLGDRLCARVDLEADRQAGVLRVLGCWHEPDAAPAQVAEPLATELADFARWLGLSRVEVADRGDLAPALLRCAG
ncbi:MAG: winged helix-turn-helix domain-containing protein [Egibacteraceae bacterium]